MNYLDQLAKFHKQHGTNLNRFPSVDKRPLDLYKLKKAVETRGGFDKVCKLKKWAEIGRDLGYSGKIMSSLSTSLKNSYQKWLHPYEEYLRVAKPGVQQQLEFEYGGPLTPSPANSPLKKTQQHTPSSLREESPAIRASTAVNSAVRENGDSEAPTPALEAPRPVISSGFTAVNAPGFTPVNPSPSFLNPHRKSAPGVFVDNGRRTIENPLPSSKNTTDCPPSALSGAPLTNGTTLVNHKRQRSDSFDRNGLREEGGASDDCENGDRRSKRFKKGTYDSPLSVL